MRGLILALCLLSAPPVWAQEPEPQAPGSLVRDWASLANAMRHVASGMTALIQERNALEARVKELEERLKTQEEKKP